MNSGLVRTCRVLPALASFFAKSLNDFGTVNTGICVSGGPDSMALSYLLQQSLGPAAGQSGYELTGLIVDHKARPESTVEAEQVRQNLRRIGIESQILTMEWPRGTYPLELSDFESQARAKRYRLLASAALNLDIRHLFLGHHQDDQVETILMRLIRNKKSSLKGLTGIAESASIPECDDIFGAHIERSPLFAAPLLFPHRESSDQTKPTKPSITMSMYRNYQIASPGGIVLHRPLLSYSKQDLIHVCESNSVPYIIDPTNKDPRASIRNAVRHLRTKYTLPQALNSARILELQMKAQRCVNDIRVAGEKYLKRCTIHSLDVRAGALTVRIPRVSSRDSLDEEGYTYALSMLMQIVSPKSRTDANANITPFVLHQICLENQDSTQGAPENAPVMSFSQGQVQFDAHPTLSEVWVLSRQPMRSSEIEDNTRHFIISKKAFGASASNGKTRFRTDFLLWDNRFWLRLYADSPKILEDIEVRPYHETDAHVLRDSEREHPNDLRSVLKKVAPGKMRSTLPVLTYKSKLVAFPTLHRRVQNVVAETELSNFTWEVRYNSFNLIQEWKENQVHPNEGISLISPKMQQQHI